jgi:hypothetical protein
VPELPEDRFDLRRWVGEFEDARAAFDRRYGEGLQSAGTRVAEFVVEVVAADGSPVPAGGAPR